MPITERKSQRLMARSGSTTLTLSKEAGQATMQRKLLFWNLKPAEAPLSDIADVKVEAAVDRASCVDAARCWSCARGGNGRSRARTRRTRKRPPTRFANFWASALDVDPIG